MTKSTLIRSNYTDFERKQRRKGREIETTGKMSNGRDRNTTRGYWSSTCKEEIILRQPDDDDATTSSAAAFHSSSKNRYKSCATNERGEFWGVLARKGKSILEDEVRHKSNTNRSKKPESVRFSTSSQFTGIQIQHQFESYKSLKKMDNLSLRMGLDKLVSSLNQIGVATGNDLEAEKKTQNNIKETHNMQNRRAFDDFEQNQNQETQIQASRDVALAKAAKVKQLIRKLKTAAAELAFVKERCCQLEEENKLLQEGQQKVDHHADDDMIRVQLETLLVEKGRLAHENSVYARENRFLRDIVEFQLMKMQDMVYFYEAIKETFQDSVEKPVTSAQSGLESSSQLVT
ncbi:uncharacterized protein LOC143545984 [Bidens hawaiensis]|uniref:uncharacterized protein LOC143545984 n=1 Tax=Bidens hawaiensis TaxID=980011 RepID=UPI00404960A2